MGAPRVRELVRLDAAAWDAALNAAGRPFRFSHRAAAGLAFEAGFAEMCFAPAKVSFDDGVELLVPLMHLDRRLHVLSIVLGMPLGLEGTPVALAGEMGPAHLPALRPALGGPGSLIVSGGAGGSPPAVGGVQQHTTHVLDLREGFETIWERRFSGKNRNSTRKAERSGVEVRRERGEEAVAAYRALYERSARSWGYDEPPYPAPLLSELAASEHAELWLARLDGRPIASALLLRGSDDLLYWSGSMLREHQGVAPSNAILAAAIRSACEAGVAFFDFGASSGLAGVEAFKKSFGAESRDYRTVELTTRRYRLLERSRRAVSR